MTMLAGGVALVGGLLCFACMAGCGWMLIQGVRRLGDSTRADHDRSATESIERAGTRNRAR